MAALLPDGSDSGNACFGSGWGEYLGAAFLDFVSATGLSALETEKKIQIQNILVTQVKPATSC